ncbi:hypothetical protein BRADI_1g63260v3 [Brachypodium distachyon]|uniref:Uncharacterized protein n=1 Tax=Brachypodium distachyon TaxID=15368 RepID=I1H5S4_BRADI|nr:hypothetical protein BRADI_1g63260v3 [Brachypodium distachyon]
MQPVRPRTAALPLPCALVANGLRTTSLAAAAAGVVSPTTAAAVLLRAQRDGRADPPVVLVARRDDGAELAEEEDKDGDFLAPEEELELLEHEAMRGGDGEGRSPTDYDRRAHIFEESSRVFRDLKQRRDDAGAGAARHG